MLRPLKGTRVLEIGNAVSVAFATRILGDLGAEVVKLEAPAAREENVGDDRVAAAFYGYLNHGKRRAQVDLGSPDGAALARRLAENCDAMLFDPHSTRPGCFDPADREWTARPVIVAVSLFGLIGEHAGSPGDPFTVEHASGFAFHQASPVESPAETPPLHCADHESTLIAGVVAANAALSAIRCAKDRRPGPLIDISQEDVLAYLLVEPFALWQEGGCVEDRRRAADQRITIAGGLVWLLHCADGAILVSPREDHQWERWIAVIGNPEWAQDNALCGDRTVRKANALKLLELMSPWARQQKIGQVFELAQANRVACFPVSTADTLLDNRQLAFRGFFNRLTLPDGTLIPVPGLPFQMTGQSGATLDRATPVALRRRENAASIGWTAERTAELSRKEAV